jgi:hypothetical protein
MKDLLKHIQGEVSEMGKNITFPVVMKNVSLKLIEVIYRDRVEFYNYSSTSRDDVRGGEVIYKYDPYHEVDMAKNNGFKEIHAQESWLTKDESIN